MAVFPDRIVLKNSIDADADIRNAIGFGGSDEVVPGEIVLGLSAGKATLYTKDAQGTVVVMGSASNFTNPMTTAGDMLFTNANAETARLPIGTSDQILRASTGNEPEWYTPLFINGLVEDTTPQLGGALDVQNFHIVSTGTNDIVFGPPGSQSVKIRGNLDDARLSLNSFGNNYSVELKAPPASANANYTLTLPGGPGSAGQVLSTDGSGTTSWITAGGSIDTSLLGDLQDVTITNVESGEILQYDGSSWVNASVTGVDLGSASIGDLGDVDLSGVSDGNLLQYNSSSGKWLPASPSGTDVSGANIGDLNNVDNTTNALATGDVLEYNGTDWVNVQSRQNSLRTYSLSRAVNASRNFNLPASMSGILISMTSTIDAWITIYSDNTSRTNDASRPFTKDPDLSSGVIVDAYLTANVELLLTPAIPYFSGDVNNNMRIRARDQAGLQLASAFDVTVKMYTN